MEPDQPIKSVGAELVRASEEWQRSPGESLAELFPYVFEASKRMSTREISRWLEETHGIKISQPTVSRALRNPDKYWQSFAESLEPYALRVARVVEPTVGSFMADPRVFEWATQEENMDYAGASEDGGFTERAEIVDAIQFLRDHWFCLSEGTRSHMNHFFEDEEGPEENNETDSK